jgi:hypothetical protein
MKTPQIKQFDTFTSCADHRVAIACGNNGYSLHTGLLIKVDGDVKMLHFAWDRDLRFDADFASYDHLVWMPFGYYAPGNDPDGYFNDVLIGLAHRVYSRNATSLRYGINYFGDYFDDNGALHQQAGTVGLTCATFLLALFRGSAGLHLLEYERWPARAEMDAELQQRAVRNMRRPGQDREQAKRIEAENVKARYLPEEVTAASARLPLPASFDYCNKVGVQINDVLNA